MSVAPGKGLPCFVLKLCCMVRNLPVTHVKQALFVF